MFCHWPARVPARTIDFPVSSLDLYPTFAALADAKIPADKKLDGVDLMAGLKSGENPRKGQPIFAMRHNNTFSDTSVRVDDWKVVRQGNQAWRLFDIAADPGESKDVASQHPQRVAELVKQGEQWSRTHAAPLFFHASGMRDAWAANKMPHFNRTFTADIGAPALGPVRHITDGVFASEKLNPGDSTLEQYVAREKAKWQQKGWRWDQEKVVANFAKIDTDGNGIITGKEKKTYYRGAAPKPAAPPAAAPAKPAADVKLKRGDSDLAHFISVRKALAEKKGQPFNRAGVEKMFAEMDTDKNGIVTGLEKKAYWKVQAGK